MVNPAVLSAASNPQFTLQFLSSVLSQRGPSALPYSEDAKWLIRQHLLSLTSSYASLESKTAFFTHNDGRSVNLLQADGTVPMTFQSATYNIPVIIWLVDSYPRHPPTVYVNPTRDMIIKRPHPHVDPSGVVSFSYLQNWIYPSSNLVELVRNLSIIFSRDPPLYSQRRPNSTPTPTPTPTPSPNPSPLPLPSADHSVSSHLGSTANDRPSIPPRPYPQSPYGVNSVAPGRLQPHTEEPNEVRKRNAITKLVENVHSDIVGLRKTREAEMEGLFCSQGELRQREKQLNHGLKEMLDEKEGLEQQLQTTLMNTDILQAWLTETKGKMGGLVNLEVDDAFNSVDLPSKQILECTASDLAVEDVIYSLDKAVQEGSIPFDQYLRNVRLLCREQFVHRAMAVRVRTTQIQSQVANMASRISHYVS